VIRLNVISVLLFFLLWLSSFYAKSEFNPNKIHVANINLAEGLSQCVVTNMALDSRGFLWLGTFDGLNRFDGSQIKVFKHIPNDSLSIPSSKIYTLFADQNFHLWLGTPYGLSIFDTRTAKTVTPRYLRNMHPYWLCQGSKNEVWMYTPLKGLYKINPSDFSYSLFTFRPNQNFIGAKVIGIQVQNNHVYIVNQSGDILKYAITTNTYATFKNTGTINIEYDCVGADRYGNLLLGSKYAPMLQFDIRHDQFGRIPYLISSTSITSVRSVHYNASMDMLLLGTYGTGLYVYDYKSKDLKHYAKNESEFTLTSNFIEFISSNQHGIIYLGYDGMGLDVLDPFTRKFVSIRRDNEDDLRSLRFVRKIIEDDQGNLLMGTSGSGLIKYNRSTEAFTFFNNQNLLTSSDNFIIEMLRVGNELWLGYNGYGVDILDLQTLQRKGKILAGTDSKQLTEGTIWSMLYDSEGYVWIGTRNNGLNKIHLASRTVKQFSRETHPILSSGLRCMKQLQNGNILIGTEDGLFELSKSSDAIRKVFPQTKEDAALKTFKTIHIDHKQRIWLGGDGLGIMVLSKEYTLLNHFNSANALNNDVVYGILPENDSSFWISSNAGLSRIQWNDSSLVQDGKIHVFNYDEDNGLQSREFNTGAYTMLSDGSFAFGGISGVNVFKPADIQNTQMLPKVYIQDFKVFENVLQTDSLVTYMNTVFLRHFENSFSISFGTIGLSLKGKTRYKYQLKGHHDAWIDAGPRNYVSFTNMESGDYEFRVKACNQDGIWNEEYASLNIHIATPFYKTWWFLMIIFMIILQIIFAWFRYRQRISREKEALQLKHTKQLADVEMKALRAQINPHFLFNSLNSINNYILKNENTMASKYLIKFSQLVRNILNHSTNSFISLQEELQTIELYIQIEGMRFNNQFSYLIDVDPEIATADIRLPSLLLQPYVENAIWHGLLHKTGEKQISIRVTPYKNHAVSIIIDDNGVGRKMAEALERRPKDRKSFGMELGESRLKLMNQGEAEFASVDVIDKYDAAGRSQGTTIKITIPYQSIADAKSA
jgi:ligand-binding sensor domain-containing protein